MVIEKSRFIGFTRAVETRREADAFFADIRSRYRDATHAVPAFIVGAKGELKWASDDGEPQGTAGPPILQFLEREGLTNVAVCVVRYFGGKLLGTGGLVRAYTEAARAAVEAAGRAAAAEQIRMGVTFGYDVYPKLQNREKEGAFTLANVQFTDRISADLLTRPEEREQIRRLIAEWTAGAAQWGAEKQEVILLPEKVQKAL